MRDEEDLSFKAAKLYSTPVNIFPHFLGIHMHLGTLNKR